MINEKVLDLIGMSLPEAQEVVNSITHRSLTGAIIFGAMVLILCLVAALLGKNGLRIDILIISSVFSCFFFAALVVYIQWTRTPELMLIDKFYLAR